jgi:hypothetical protein
VIARRIKGASGTTIVRVPTNPVPVSSIETWDIRLYRWFSNALGVLLLAYLFLDRGIAHLHLPKTPAFIGELTLTLGVIAILFGT